MPFDSNQIVIIVSDALNKSDTAIGVARATLLDSQVRVGEDYDVKQPFLDAKLLQMKGSAVDNYHVAKGVYQSVASILADAQSVTVLYNAKRDVQNLQVEFDSYSTQRALLTNTVGDLSLVLAEAQSGVDANPGDQEFIDLFDVAETNFNNSVIVNNAWISDNSTLDTSYNNALNTLDNLT